MMRFYRQFIKAGDLCFDIGANIGERTDVFLKLNTKVICVEPQSKCMSTLQKKYQNNKNVTLVRAALGSNESEGELLLCDETDECSTLSIDFVKTYTHVSNFHWNKKEKVSVLTLESLCALYGVPKLCKIDVEGYESEVFRGMRTDIEIICFEFNYPIIADTIKCLETIALLGTYKCNFIAYERMDLMLDEWMGIKEFKDRLRELIESNVLTGEIIARRV
ncbi:MAG: FkbM family methyltransferase [Bacteroidota bacterium]|nr:FkbM family methyltransferase [Bacteroidota bacterium]